MVVAAMRDSKLRSADFIHSLLGFTARAHETAAILDPPRVHRKDFKVRKTRDRPLASSCRLQQALY